MIALAVRRLLLAIPVLFLIVSITFLLTRFMPGNPFASEKAMSPATTAAQEERYHLRGTLLDQYLRVLDNVARTGGPGPSTVYKNREVGEVIAEGLPVSIALGSVAFALAMVAGVLLGTVAAVHHNQPTDRAAMFAALAGVSIPNYVLGPVLVLLFAIYLPLLPVGGWGSISQVVLPAIVLATPFAASIARLMRTSLLDVLSQDYVRTARAKGLSESMVIGKHAMKVAILPVVSYAGPLAAAILTGGVIVETIFSIPGLGRFFVNSILNKDAPMIGGTVFVYAAFLIFFNMVVDVLYALLDRRIRLT
jgi:oligopeptide transport system permease protein